VSTTASVYGASPVKRRRRTNAELTFVDEAIVEAIRADHPVTLRGVYYRVVSAGAVDKTETGYQLVGRQLLKLRRNGSVPYSWITDGTRWVTRPTTWTGIDEMLEDAASSYRRALWHDQPHEVQIFTEKDAISGVILPITERWDVPLGVLRGYASESFAHSMAESIGAAVDRGKTVPIYPLGDHDPSGVDAWRDFQRKVTGFLGISSDAQLDRHFDKWAATGDDIMTGLLRWMTGQLYNEDDEDERTQRVLFERLAVTEEQITSWDLPTRPTKRTDTRAKGFTGGSVEADAIAANALRELVHNAIVQHIDERQMQVTEAYEHSEREIFAQMVGGDS
jgi:hypothetical protein